MRKLFILLVLATTLFGVPTNKYIPTKAYPLLPVVYENVDELFVDFEMKSYFPALFEQESCIALTYKRCWSPTSRLYATRKNGTREEGAGMPQLTRVWRRNGTVRFDTLTLLTRKYPKELAGLTWKTVYKRPKLQLKAGMLLWRDNYLRLGRNYPKMTTLSKIAMADAAYNGGYGGLRKEIRACSRKKGCNPMKWFGHVEKTCMKSKRALYGRRNACDINREHVRTIFFKRYYKYYVQDELTRKILEASEKHNH